MDPNQETEDVLSAKTAARSVLSAWRIDAEPKFLRRVENFVFEVDDRGTRRILRLTEPEHRSTAMVESELDWIAHVARQGVSVAMPIPTADGRLAVATDGGAFTAALFTFAEGRKVSWIRNPEDWNREFHEGWGELLGRLHVAQQCYERSPGVIARPRWDEESRFLEAEPVFAKDDPVLGEFRAGLAWMRSLSETPDTFGLIHYDAHYGNFHIDESGGFTLFDFDDSSYHWFAMDLSIPLYYSFHHPERSDWGMPQLRDLLKNLLVGYRRHFEIDKEWEQRIWSFIRWRRVQMHIFGLRWASERDPSILEAPWHIQNRDAVELAELPFA